MSVLQGQCVGGGSVVNNAVCFRMPDHVRGVWARDFGARWAVDGRLDAAYDRVAKDLRIAPVTTAVPDGWINPSARFLASGARALEEVIRWNSPQIGWRRVTTRDTTLGGVDLPAGTPVFLNLGAANHDPKAFADPGSFDIHRADAAKNISFGKGIHYCLGAKFARFEARVVIEVLTERVPGLALAGDQRTDPFPNISFRGPSRLQVVW